MSQRKRRESKKRRSGKPRQDETSTASRRTERGRQAALAVGALGAFLLGGVFGVILLVSLGEGARLYLSETFAGLGSNLLQVSPGRRETKGFGSPPVGTIHKLTREDEQALKRRGYSLDGDRKSVV